MKRSDGLWFFACSDVSSSTFFSFCHFLSFISCSPFISESRFGLPGCGVWLLLMFFVTPVSVSFSVSYPSFISERRFGLPGCGEGLAPSLLLFILPSASGDRSTSSSTMLVSYLNDIYSIVAGLLFHQHYYDYDSLNHDADMITHIDTQSSGVWSHRALLITTEPSWTQLLLKPLPVPPYLTFPHMPLLLRNCHPIAPFTLQLVTLDKVKSQRRELQPPWQSSCRAGCYHLAHFSVDTNSIAENKWKCTYIK